MTTIVEPPTAPWAFWAPSQDEAIASALNLAGVGGGTRFLDLGCGDGRVLVAAAKRGAKVRGIEIDADAAEIARETLAAAGAEGQVELGDIFTASLEADVIYAYLTPAILSQLRKRLDTAPRGTRVVTPRYSIAGWEPAVFENDCCLYEAPARAEVVITPRGWPWRAVLVKLPADRRVLVPLTFTAGCGPLALELDSQLMRAAKHAAGTPAPGATAKVPIDLIFEPHGTGSVIAGSISAQGSEATVAAVFTHGDRGQWNFGPDEGPAFRDALDEAITSARQAR